MYRSKKKRGVIYDIQEVPLNVVLTIYSEDIDEDYIY